MQRRKFVIGMGATAAGGAAALGTGAFSRVESQRDVTIQVANDSSAYVGLAEGATEWADNYVDEDDGDGHLEVDIGENDNGGEGVNSDSDTFFDELIQVTNQGKEEAEICFDITGLDNEANALVFYTGTAQGSDGDTGDYESRNCADDNPIELGTGESEQVGIHVNTEGVDATEFEEDPLVSGDVVVVADVEEADGAS